MQAMAYIHQVGGLAVEPGTDLRVSQMGPEGYASRGDLPNPQDGRLTEHLRDTLLSYTHPCCPPLQQREPQPAPGLRLGGWQNHSTAPRGKFEESTIISRRFGTPTPNGLLTSVSLLLPRLLFLDVVASGSHERRRLLQGHKVAVQLPPQGGLLWPRCEPRDVLGWAVLEVSSGHAASLGMSWSGQSCGTCAVSVQDEVGGPPVAEGGPL